MEASLEIKLGLGLSSLLFGSTMAEAEKEFGLADDSEWIDENEEGKTTVWYYHERGFTLFFEDRNKELFNCVDIESPEAILWGEKVFNLKENEIITLFKGKGVNGYETELHDWGEKRLSFDDVNIDFYFEGDQLMSINYGKLIQDSQILILPN